MTSYDKDRKEHTIFEKTLSELRNIEFCLNYWIDLEKHRPIKPPKIGPLNSTDNQGKPSPSKFN